MELLQKISTYKYRNNIICKIKLAFNFIILNFVLVSIWQCAYSASNVYKCLDENNNDYFTDNPKNDPNCRKPQKHELKSLPSFNSKEKLQETKKQSNYLNKNYSKYLDNSTSSNNTMTIAAKYTDITITYPKNNEAANSCGGLLSVNFNTNPPLYDDDQAQLLLNGSPHGNPTKSSSFTVQNLDRGEYTIVVQIIRDNKQIVQLSEPVSFTFLRNCAR